ncbi:uncharacterized protein ACRADG_009758 [Cochliomyia hominivorax]
MTRLSNLLVCFALNYGIFFGLTYVYVDVNKSLVKCYICVKFYVYLVNLVYVIMQLYSFVDNLDNLFFFNVNAVMAYANFILQIAPFYVLAGIIWFRFKEEIVLVKWYDIILSLQSTYFNKIPFKCNNKTIEIVHSLKIFIIIAHSCCSLLTAVRLLLRDDWAYMLDTFVKNYFILMLCHVMFHHILILHYINYCFSKLNQQLEYDQVLVPFAYIYLQLSLLLDEINTINGPIIFLVLFTTVMSNTLYVYSAIDLMYDSYNLRDYDNLMDFLVFIWLSIAIFLYFLFCDLVYRTAEDTGKILMEYINRKQNEEVETISLVRLLMKNNINICGAFVIDLSSLFDLCVEIVTLSIILIQIDYLVLKYNYVPD